MNQKIYWGIIAILSIIIIILAVQLSVTSQKLTLATKNINTSPVSNSNNPSVPSESDPTLGDPNAKVTILIYSDPSCPFCAAAAGKNQEVISYLKSKMPTWQAPIPNIIKNYVDTGQVKLIFRYFPGHGSGVQAMKIMLCANEQGKFWELHDAVFDNQDIVSDENKVKDLAKELNIDLAKIDACLESKKYDDKLDQDTAAGKAAGVKGTPAFFINDQLLSGAQPYVAFKEIIDQELSK